MDSSFLKPLYDTQGPWCSVYLSTPAAATTTARDRKRAEQAIGAHWSNLRGRLAELGAEERNLLAIDEELAADGGSPGPHGRALFAAHGSVALKRELRAPTNGSRAVFGELPDVVPLLAQTPDFSSYLLVFADGGGADVEVYEGRDTGPGNERVEEQRPEGTGTIAATAERIAGQHSAGMIAVSGEPRLRASVLEKLDPVWRRHAVELEGSEAPGTDADAVRRQAASAAAGFEQEWRSALMERYADGLAQGTAVNGLEATVESLRAGDVGTLFVRPDAPQAKTAVWWGPGPGLLAEHQEDLENLQVPRVRRGRAADVLVRAATLEGGDLVLLSDAEPGPRDAVGAILRGGSAKA